MEAALDVSPTNPRRFLLAAELLLLLLLVVAVVVLLVLSNAPLVTSCLWIITILYSLIMDAIDYVGLFALSVVNQSVSLSHTRIPELPRTRITTATDGSCGRSNISLPSNAAMTTTNHRLTVILN